METTGARGPSSKHLDVAAAHTDLGLPVPRGTRFRFAKRALGRLMWAFGRDQSLYNHAMLEAVSDLANAVDTMRTAIPEQVGNEVGGMRTRASELEIELRRVSERIDDLSHRVDELARRLGT